MRSNACSTACKRNTAVLHQMACRCGWLAGHTIGTVKGMNLALPLLRRSPSASPDAHWHPCHLAPGAAPHAIRLGRGVHQLLSTQGRIWLTREGDPRDYFVEPGQSLRLAGPARLHVSAEGGRAAVLHWQPC